MPMLPAMLLVILIAALARAALSGIHAYVCLSLRANQIVSGLALSILGTGLSYYIGKVFITDPTALLNDKLTAFTFADGINIPFVGELIRIFLNQDPLVYISYISVFIVWYFIYKTQKGLNLRAIGENPGAADAGGASPAGLHGLQRGGDRFSVGLRPGLFLACLHSAGGAFASRLPAPRLVERTGQNR